MASYQRSVPRTIRRLGFAGALTLALGTQPAAQPAAQPNNVLILLADDVGVDKIGAYGVGSAPPPTPNIDALAQRGVLFRNVWTSPLCSPTRGQIMTGRYPFRTGVGAATLPLGGVMRYEETTIAELLDREGSGYAHAMIGKWHIGDERNGGLLGPNLAGWSHFAGFMTGVGSYYYWPRVENGVLQFSSVYNTTACVDDALAWIATAPEPWVCYVAFQAAHGPFRAPPRSLHTQVIPPFEPPGVVLYNAMVEAMDTEIGRLLRGLGTAQTRTDVIFLGDNGTPMEVIDPPYQPFQGKGSPYQGGIHVPMIVAGPSVAAPGREVDALVGAVDVFATVVDLCGVEPTVPGVALDAVSFAPYLRDPQQPNLRTHVMSEMFQGLSPPTPTAILAYRDQRYKLIQWSWSTREEFYDLAVDPFEATDLLAVGLSPAEDAVYRALRDGIARLRRPQSNTSAFGNASCIGTAGSPRISPATAPVLGRLMTVQLDNAPPAQPVLLMLGGSNTRWGPAPLPFELTAIGGAPGCALLVSPDFLLPTASDPAGRASVSVPIMSDPVFWGGSLYAAWLVFDPTAPQSPAGLTASDALQLTLGYGG